MVLTLEVEVAIYLTVCMAWQAGSGGGDQGRGTGPQVQIQMLLTLHSASTMTQGYEVGKAALPGHDHFADRHPTYVHTKLRSQTYKCKIII